MSLPQPAAYLGSTRAVLSGAAFDDVRLARYLEAHIPGFKGPLAVEQFEGGQSNPTFLLITPDRRYVLRRKPEGALLKSAHAVDREYHVTRALFEAKFPAPEPLVLCEDESVIGTIFYVMAHVPGRVFWDPKMPQISRGDRAAIYDSANAALAALHTVDHVALGLETFGRPGNYFARQISRWSRQYEASRTVDLPDMDRLMEWLPGAIPDDGDRSALIHGDFSFHNLLVHPTEPRVVAVLDWELSTLGNPIGDLTYHMMEWFRPVGVDLRGTLAGSDFTALGIPTAEEYAQRYRDRTGFDVDANNPFYRAFNLFRVAAILQGIAGRARDGVQTDAKSAEIITRIKPLAEAAWREAQSAGAS